MELRQLRYFLAVADELHFAHAAQRLHITSPPLTVAIRQLERDLGVVLFERSTRHVALTSAGIAFRERVQSALGDLDDAAADALGIAKGFKGKVRVGFVSSASYRIVPEAVRAFRLSRPGVDVTLHPLTSGEQVERLLDRSIDLGLVRDPGATSGLVLDLIHSEGLVAVLPEGHALTARQTIDPGVLRGEQMVFFPYRLMPGFVTRVTGVLRDAGVTPHVAQHAVHQETVLGLVAAGIGISILPESVERFRMPGVTYRSLLGRPTTELYCAMTTSPSRATAAFANCLKSLALGGWVNHDSPHGEAGAGSRLSSGVPVAVEDNGPGR